MLLMGHCQLAVFRDLWCNQSWQWLDEGCHKPMLGVWTFTFPMKEQAWPLGSAGHKNTSYLLTLGSGSTLQAFAAFSVLSLVVSGCYGPFLRLFVMVVTKVAETESKVGLCIDMGSFLMSKVTAHHQIERLDHAKLSAQSHF